MQLADFAIPAGLRKGPLNVASKQTKNNVGINISVKPLPSVFGDEFGAQKRGGRKKEGEKTHIPLQEKSSLISSPAKPISYIHIRM
jgi:hypothetical protein